MGRFNYIFTKSGQSYCKLEILMNYCHFENQDKCLAAAPNVITITFYVDDAFHTYKLFLSGS